MFKSKRFSIGLSTVLLTVAIAVAVYVIATAKTMQGNEGTEASIQSSISDFVSVGYSVVALFIIYAVLFLFRAYFYVSLIRVMARIKYIIAELILLLGVCAFVAYGPISTKVSALIWQLFALSILVTYIYAIVFMKVSARERDITAKVAKP